MCWIFIVILAIPLSQQPPIFRRSEKVPVLPEGAISKLLTLSRSEPYCWGSVHLLLLGITIRTQSQMVGDRMHTYKSCLLILFKTCEEGNPLATISGPSQVKKMLLFVDISVIVLLKQVLFISLVSER